MNTVEDKKKRLLSWTKISIVSIVIHVIAFIFITFLANLSIQNALVNPAFYTIEFDEFINTSELFEKENLEEIENEEIAKPEEISSSENFTFRDIDADTTNLDQLYKENTLNVSIKYPKGWTFIDQNIKNRLDGVTFWASEGSFNPPPYIHLEVKEKYYFNELKYKYQVEFENCTAYFNDPEIIEDHYIQNVYLRTEISEDFNIKLMMVGKEAFYSFQPKFFGMIRTFDFGKSFF
jgi:hypothetical protein